MKTLPFLLVSSVAALLLVGVTGCQSSNATSSDSTRAPAVGAATGAVMLSREKTFDIIGRTGKPVTYSKPESPQADVTSATIRDKLESLGYKYQPGSADFVVSVAWDKYKENQQPSLNDPQNGGQVDVATVAVRKATLSIEVRDTASATVLWQGPVSQVVDPQTLTGDQAAGLATVALKDFPPAQSSVATR